MRTINEQLESAKRLHLLAKRSPKARRLYLLKLAFLGRMLARAQGENQRNQQSQEPTNGSGQSNALTLAKSTSSSVPSVSTTSSSPSEKDYSL